MKKIITSLFCATWALGIFATPDTPDRNHVFDDNVVELLLAVKDCSNKFEMLGPKIKDAKVEYLYSPHGSPDYQLYTIRSSHGDFWGPTLTMHRQASGDGTWETKYDIAH